MVKVTSKNHILTAWAMTRTTEVMEGKALNARARGRARQEGPGQGKGKEKKNHKNNRIDLPVILY